MPTANPKSLILIGVIAAAGALGAVGWVRAHEQPAGNPSPPPITASQSSAPVYDSDGYYPSRMRPVYVRQNPPVEAVAAPAPRRVVYEQEYYRDSHGRRRSRSKAHSVEIVAGSAGAGAAIGAIAGGGKGAGIGALAGGGAGFVYDRLTHNH